MTTTHTGMADVNGAQLYYETAGEGHPFIMVHAGICDNHMWDAQFAYFANKYHVIRYDMRGFGKSTMPPGPAALRDDLYGVLRFLGVERAYVMGCSMAGGAAIDFTLDHPEMVDALIPVCAGLSGFESEDEDEYAEVWPRVEAAEKAGDLDLVNTLELDVFVSGRGRTPEQVAPGVYEKVREMNGANLARGHEMEQAQFQRLDPPAAGRLAELHAPTLIIEGELDERITLMMGEAMAAGIAGARLVLMTGVAHVPNMEKPDEFNRVVEEFLNRLS
ncbi:MAG: alpha/beta fold hydrolase [Ktedonobacterales bacterium]